MKQPEHAIVILLLVLFASFSFVWALIFRKR